MAQKMIRELAIKKKVEIQYVDKMVLERLSGKKPHQVGKLRCIKSAVSGGEIVMYDTLHFIGLCSGC